MRQVQGLGDLAVDVQLELSGGAVARITASDMDEIVVTDTIPLSPEAQACPRIRPLSCAQLLAETMTRISNEESVSSLFID